MTPPTSSTVLKHTFSTAPPLFEVFHGIECWLHRYLLSSTSGLDPWRIPAGDGVAGQLPKRGSFREDNPLVTQHCSDVDLR